MPADKSLREHLIKLLKGGDAHADFAKAIADFPAELRGKTPKGAAHSPWQLLEHLRIAQWDLLEFSRNEEHKSPDWPSGYWPKEAEPTDSMAWDRTVHGFFESLDAMCKLIEDEQTDLYAKIPHGDGQTILREALVLADHNAYHLGQIVLLRRMLGAWSDSGSS